MSQHNFRTTIAIAAVVLIAGCARIGYYRQAVAGHLRITMATEPVGPLLAADDTSAELRRQLLLVRKILDFAQSSLLLNTSDSYTKYADLGQKYVLWNIFAAPQLSLQPIQWCFPVVGCLAYKGYFDKHAAEDEATRLRLLGYDVYIGGVVAYSTLGWFDDQLLNTMLYRTDADLVKLLIHELVHGNIYIRDDPDFNEALAEAVAVIALSRWDKHDRHIQRSIEAQKNNIEHKVMDLVLKGRDDLDVIYSGVSSDSQKLKLKESVISAMQAEYESLKAAMNAGTGFDNWMYTEFNNAKIASVSTYRYLVPGLLAIYDILGKDISTFYEYTTNLSRCDVAMRHTIIRAADSTASC